MSEILQPGSHERAMINQQREELAATMNIENVDNPLIVIAGPCAADMDTLPNGEYATAHHLEQLQRVAKSLSGIVLVGRLAGTKPRTNVGQTGLIHAGLEGARAYTAMARDLSSRAAIPLAAEILDMVDYDVASPWMNAVWIGARNDRDTSVRYLARHTQEEAERGIAHRPVFVKNSVDGELSATFDTLTTILSKQPVSRTRLSAASGYESVTTIANPNVGIILRGGGTAAAGGDPAESLLLELLETDEKIMRKFPDASIPLIVDVSHGNAARFGGGEQGQLHCLDVVRKLIIQNEVRIDGVMMETYIEPGNQAPTGDTPGKSRTDACIGQNDALQALRALDEAKRNQLVAV